MYINYGDKNFFEYGVLVDSEHSDTEINIIRCLPYDEENRYQFNECTVDITDSWIDKKAVMNFIGMTEENFDPIQFAIGCTDYYSWDNFGYPYHYNWQYMTKEDICEILKYKPIANDNLNVEW